MEEWKDIQSFDNYQISNYGRIKNKSTNKLLTEQIDRKGYAKIYLYSSAKRHAFAIHRLVAEYFLEPPTIAQLEWAESTIIGKVQVNHKDNNRSNNHYTNLEWCTGSENINHAYNLGNKIGKATTSKLSREQVIQIRFEYESYSGSKLQYTKDVCGKYNVSSETIRKILYNQTWKD